MQNFEYENIQVIEDLVNELNVLLKRENSLQDSISSSINRLNDYRSIQEIKAIMEKSSKTTLNYDEQKMCKNLLITDNIFTALFEEHLSIFKEIGLNINDVVKLTVEEQNALLKQLLKKVTSDNNKLIDYLKYEQSDDTLVVVNKFKIFINNQYTKFLSEISEQYRGHVFPLEDAAKGISGVNNLTTLKKIHLILVDIGETLHSVNN
ncbi:hypothetical protein ACO0OL_003890 [Hanseniaspora opuntiae]